MFRAHPGTITERTVRLLPILTSPQLLSLSSAAEVLSSMQIVGIQTNVQHGTGYSPGDSRVYDRKRREENFSFYGRALVSLTVI